MPLWLLFLLGSSFPLLHPEIVQHFPHEQLHSDLVPSMNPVLCKEYSQVRHHINHCLNQEDKQVHKPASQKREKLLLW